MLLRGAEAKYGRFELSARGVEPRVRRLQGASDHDGHLVHRQLFDLVKDEDFTLLFVEVVEEAIERRPGLAQRRVVFLVCVHHLLLLLYPLNDDFVPLHGTLAMLGGRSDADSIEPGSGRGAPFEACDAAMDRNEHFLADVVGVSFGVAEPSEDPPGGRTVLAEETRRGERRTLAWTRFGEHRASERPTVILPTSP